MDAVPGDRDQAADDRRDVRPEDAEGATAHDGVRHTRLLAGLGDQVAQQVHDDDAHEQRDQHLPAGRSEGEQAARGDVAATLCTSDIQNAKMLAAATGGGRW